MAVQGCAVMCKRAALAPRWGSAGQENVPKNNEIEVTLLRTDGTYELIGYAFTTILCGYDQASG